LEASKRLVTRDLECLGSKGSELLLVAGQLFQTRHSYQARWLAFTIRKGSFIRIQILDLHNFTKTAGMAPISRKRSTPSQSDDDVVDEPTSKRRCVEPALPQTPPPEEDLIASIGKTHLFDDEQRQFLLRSVALTLEHVGFSGAQEEALEALCAEVDAC